MKKVFLLILVSVSFLACEQVIDLEVKDGVSQLVVDAWLTDEQKEQSIKLTLSQPYFEEADPQPALGAQVIVYNEDSTAHVFTDIDNDGIYTYTPKNNEYLKQDERTALYIKYENEEYYSLSELKRVPKIDSIGYEVFSFPITPPNGGPKDGFLAQFYANDIVGDGDTYMIRSYKNDTLRFAPNDITLAYDAGFSAGSKSDGLLFILPIRQSINQTLFLDKDKLKVELFSIPVEAYYYLFQLKQESSNGGIFATPLSNIPTNIINLNGQSTKKAIGAFFVSKVSTFETVIDKSLAKPKQ
ncbi:DUF4249 domain-containing protein [Lacihabitans sp. LS3-19]|uniref:DUF4249 domain-containing protein n=1 Tax=Lacihabitans sp. LS3-19 TaxID=2487335 RepID=UPI0020CCA9B6|nr:DUF4249 domain-containing protein [Lacihabitans sp. LS3-19]MCP9767869.1 DUF4249 domain-containing protein [Lacihabitans sp. LS3-19]